MSRSRLAPSSSGAAALEGRAFLLFDSKGEKVGEQKLDKRGDFLARFGEEEWLVLGEKQKHLARVSVDKAASPFANGKAVIGAFGVGRDDAVAVARGDTMELWSRDDKKCWSSKGVGVFLQTVVARDQVIALGEDGALYFFAREKGDPLGALRLASPDPVDTWRLVHVDNSIIVLALGEWLVWIDAAIRKTVRRVRARAKVVEITADLEHVVAFIEDGFIQAFRAKSGEPRASFAVFEESAMGGEGEAADLDALAIVLGASALFTMGAGRDDDKATVRAHDRQMLDVTAAAASPISSVIIRGSLAAVADRSGRVRLMQVGAGAEPLREIASTSGNEGTVGLHLTKRETLIAAGQRVVMRFPAPYKTPLPMALRTAPTAFAADDAYAFIGTQNGSVDVYDLAIGRPVTTYTLSSDDRITALYRLAGAMLVVGTGALDGRVLVVDVAESKVVHRVEPHDEAFGVVCLAADARGRIVASGGDDGSVALIDPVKGRVLARLRVPETPTAMAFEPSGRRLACVFADGTARVATFAQKGASWSDLGLRGVTSVAWGDSLILGFKDGHVESGERHARPSDRPTARQ